MTSGTKHPLVGHQAEFLLYQTEDGRIQVETRLQDETVWLTQQGMAELFQTTKQNISLHIHRIFQEQELHQEATVKQYLTVRKEGKREIQRELEYYNLDMIISVGYRVRSAIATKFRIWATQHIKEYIVKGFLLDDRRLKEPAGGRYFEELLARIRDIRSSEKIFWRKVLDIYATSIDYDPHAEITQEFFRQVQNKMHWAAHGHTAAELIYQRADAASPQMGVTNYPGKTLLRRDVEVAKNYLTEEELNLLNRMVTAYLEVAELQALGRIPMTMTDWISRLHQFLTMTGREILDHVGKISHEEAMVKAHEEYEKYRQALQNHPTEVEKHFIEAEEKLKAIVDGRKRRP